MKKLIRTSLFLAILTYMEAFSAPPTEEPKEAAFSFNTQNNQRFFAPDHKNFETNAQMQEHFESLRSQSLPYPTTFALNKPLQVASIRGHEQAFDRASSIFILLNYQDVDTTLALAMALKQARATVFSSGWGGDGSPKDGSIACRAGFEEEEMQHSFSLGDSIVEIIAPSLIYSKQFEIAKELLNRSDVKSSYMHSLWARFYLMYPPINPYFDAERGRQEVLALREEDLWEYLQFLALAYDGMLDGFADSKKAEEIRTLRTEALSDEPPYGIKDNNKLEAAAALLEVPHFLSKESYTEEAVRLCKKMAAEVRALNPEIQIAIQRRGLEDYSAGAHISVQAKKAKYSDVLSQSLRNFSAEELARYKELTFSSFYFPENFTLD